MDAMEALEFFYGASAAARLSVYIELHDFFSITISCILHCYRCSSALQSHVAIGKSRVAESISERVEWRIKYIYIATCKFLICLIVWPGAACILVVIVNRTLSYIARK